MKEPMFAVILDIWKDEPVYHKKAGHGPGIASWQHTKCGREIGLFKPLIPTKHAKKFARPCKGCFDDN